MDDLRFLNPEALVNRAAFNERFGMLNDLMFGLGNQYLWEKNLVEATYDVDKKYNESFLNLPNATTKVALYYSDEIRINTTDKTASLINPQSITVSYSTNLAFLLGKYWFNNSNENLITVYYMPPDVSISGPNFNAGMYNWTTSEYHILTNFRNKYTLVSYVNSSSPDAYPPAEPDGYTYTALGQVGDRCRVEYGSYLGTGTNGSNNQNELNFSFSPKFGIVHRKSASDSASAFILFVKGVVASQTVAGSTGNTTTNTWMETSVRWYAANAESQMNTNGVEYYYTFIG